MTEDGPRVLIVDDDDFTRITLRAVITSLGYTAVGDAAGHPAHRPSSSEPCVTGGRPTERVDRGPHVRVTPAQPRCFAQLWVKGDTSSVRVNSSGRARGVLTAPSKPGTWVVTARIKGPGCAPVVVRQAITTFS